MPRLAALALVAALCAAAVPAQADDALDDRRATARSWVGAARRIAAGTLDGSLPDVYVDRALTAATDGLDDVAGWMTAHVDRDPAVYRAAIRAVAGTRETVQRLQRAAARHDRPATNGALDELRSAASALVPASAATR